jgi:hypothetical protein
MWCALGCRLQAESWGGSLSAAVYIRPEEATGPRHDEILTQLRALHADIEGHATGCRLTLSLLYAVDPKTVMPVLITIACSSISTRPPMPDPGPLHPCLRAPEGERHAGGTGV